MVSYIGNYVYTRTNIQIDEIGKWCKREGIGQNLILKKLPIKTVLSMDLVSMKSIL